MRVICDFGTVLADAGPDTSVITVGGAIAEALAPDEEPDCDPSFPRFVDWCAAEGVPLALVCDSDGPAVTDILVRHGLDHLERHATAIRHEPSQGLSRSSEAGFCRCELAAGGEDGEILVYIGQGRADFCASARAGVLFARGELAAYAADRKRGYFPFRTFDDIASVLSRMRRPGGAQRSLRVV